MSQSPPEDVEKASRSLELDQVCEGGGEQPGATEEGGLEIDESYESGINLI